MGAVKRGCAEVDRLMLDQIATEAERLAAAQPGAQERFFSGMDTPVPGKVNPGTKPACAAFIRTGTWPVIAMHILMHLQGVPVSEPSATALIRTDKGTDPSVDKLVGAQRARIVEGFATALKRADKRPLSGMAIDVNAQDRRADKRSATGFVRAEHAPGSAVYAPQMGHQATSACEATGAGVTGADMRPFTGCHTRPRVATDRQLMGG